MEEAFTRYRTIWKTRKAEEKRKAWGVRAWRTVMLYFLASAVLGSLIPPHRSFAADGEAISANDQKIFEQLGSGKRTDQESLFTEPEEPTVYLTFDDGPSGLTPQVLDILQKEDVKATFFVLGENAERKPDLVKRMVNEGHAVGNHSYDHVYKELYSDFHSFWDQLQRTENIIVEQTGERTPLVRAPGGTYKNFDPFYFYLLSEAGYLVHDWSIDSEDSRAPRRTAAQLVETVKNSPLRHEVTVLMHDGAGHEPSVKALPDIIAYFKEKGYRFAKLTAEVKPVQFSTAPSKWSRHVSKQSFAELLAEAREHRVAQTSVENSDAAAAGESSMETAQNTAEGKVLTASEAGMGMPEGTTQGVRVSIDHVDVDFPAGMFIFRKGHFEVPLRKLAESLGAQVYWSEKTRTASVQYGTHVVEYDLANVQMRVHKPLMAGMDPKRAVQVTALPDMELRSGAIYVPLLETLELFGVSVQTYEPETAEHPAIVTAFTPRSFTLEAMLKACQILGNRVKV